MSFFTDNNKKNKFLMFQMILVILGAIYVLYSVFSMPNGIFRIFAVLAYVSLILYVAFDFKNGSDLFYKATVVLLIVIPFVYVVCSLLGLMNVNSATFSAYIVSLLVNVVCLPYFLMNLHDYKKAGIAMAIPLIYSILAVPFNILTNEGASISIIYTIIYGTVALIYYLRTLRGEY